MPDKAAQRFGRQRRVKMRLSSLADGLEGGLSVELPGNKEGLFREAVEFLAARIFDHKDRAVGGRVPADGQICTEPWQSSGHAKPTGGK